MSSPPILNASLPGGLPTAASPRGRGIRGPRTTRTTADDSQPRRRRLAGRRPQSARHGGYLLRSLSQSFRKVDDRFSIPREEEAHNLRKTASINSRLERIKSFDRRRLSSICWKERSASSASSTASASTGWRTTRKAARVFTQPAILFAAAFAALATLSGASDFSYHGFLPIQYSSGTDDSDPSLSYHNPSLDVDILNAVLFNTNISLHDAGVRVNYHGPSYSQSRRSHPKAATASPTIILEDGKFRQIEVPRHVFEKIAILLKSSHDFTVIANVLQDQRNVGTLLSISSGNKRHFEIQSSGFRNELRLIYRYNSHPIIETFPYRLADGRWHKLAITISGGHVTLYIDCNKVYERVIIPIDTGFIFDKETKMFLGQPGMHLPQLFKGSLHDVRMIFRPNGYLKQCPNANSVCPTCGEFQDLKSVVNQLTETLTKLSIRLEHAEGRVSELEKCECRKPCIFRGQTFSHESEFDDPEDKCSLCKCVKGETTCGKKPCPKPNCAQTRRPAKGQCCPTCRRKFRSNPKPSRKWPRVCNMGSSQPPLDVGEYRRYGDLCCTCSRMGHIPKRQCHKVHCNCGDRAPGPCCPECLHVPHADAARLCGPRRFGLVCHPNATCLAGYNPQCMCNPGFKGNGTQCNDVDECGLGTYHCPSWSQCINTVGSYSCECKHGFESSLVIPKCEDIDECKGGGHNCSEDADCINAIGTFYCRCKEGFRGNGFSCERDFYHHNRNN